MALQGCATQRPRRVLARRAHGAGWKAPENDAGVSGAQGLIAFTASEPDEGPITVGGSGSGEPDPARIYVVDPDGTHRRALTGGSLLKGSLAWSPDGSMLAFTTFDLDRMRERLSVMSSTGADRRVISAGYTGTFWVDTDGGICVDGGCPAAAPFADRLTWSPDGRWLAAPSTHDGGLVIVDVATGEAHSDQRSGGRGGTPGPRTGRSSLSRWTAAVSRRAGPGRVPTCCTRAIPTWGALRPGRATDPRSPSGRPSGSGEISARSCSSSTSTMARVAGSSAPGCYSRSTTWNGLPSGDRLAVLHHPVHPPTAALLTVATDGSDVRMLALCENGRDATACVRPTVAASPGLRRVASLAFRNYDGRRSALTVFRIGGRALPISGA